LGEKPLRLVVNEQGCAVAWVFVALHLVLKLFEFCTLATAISD
jgi:hypothetical protein